jgi:hypothetical protein
VESRNSYLEFLNLDESMGLEESAQLVQMKQLYADMLKENKDYLQKLSELEEIIIQIRCKEVINSELRLSLSRNYIYARSMFFRRGKEINDIRVIVGTIEAYPYPLDDLIKDDEFRLMCRIELNNAMNREIEKNINQLNKVYANE